MRALAIVGLKLMGISSLYRATGIIPSIANALAFLSSPPAGINLAFYIGQIIGLFVINLLFALILLFRTEWVVSKLRIPAESSPFSVAASDLLRIGLVIVGVFAIIHALSESGSILLNALMDKQSSSFSSYNMGRVIQVLLELLLGVIVIGGSRRIASKVFPVSFNRA